MFTTYNEYQQNLQDFIGIRQILINVLNDPNTSRSSKRSINRVMRDAAPLNDRLEVLTTRFQNSSYLRRRLRNRPPRQADWVAIEPTCREMAEVLTRLKGIIERALRAGHCLHRPWGSGRGGHG